ncbi:acyl-CoA dehydrogenase family protein [Virgibacillus dokdonensis]|uniref:Acyl-CoA dehydrogenase n=1 Tax=Virgibacillus dokdonensis TaxID=302167 RepID=A0A2K9IZC1_9BACI|nr:acyl-CoA dehydrogenase family protein [Virgibacillus dokdonensis]AUJ24133.1 Acyl-CoA dehydrogenase [Virgibacillus dokdonensis]
MINLELTPEQLEIKEISNYFAINEIRPVAKYFDEKEIYPRLIVEKAHKLGLTTLTFPKKFGGQGITDPLIPLIMIEELAWGCAGINAAITSSYLPAEAIFSLGNYEQQERFIPIFGDKKELKIGAVALTESEAGSNISSMKTRAVKKGDYYVLNGSKKFIGNGGIADIHIIFAKVEDDDGFDTIAPFVIDNKEIKGFSLVKKDEKMGIRATHTAEIKLENVEIPVENRLSKGKSSKEDYRGLLNMLNNTRPLVSAAAVGLARAAFEYSLDYAKNRIQFNQPIINHQGIGFLLTEMTTKIDAARLLTWQAGLADSLEKGLKSSKAKLYSAEIAMEVTTNAVQILGGHGYVKEHPVEKWMRDAKIFQIWEGTSEIQKLNIIRYLKNQE